MKMKITTIKYERLVTTGSYNNFRISAEAEVDDRQHAEESIRDLAELIDDKAQCLYKSHSGDTYPLDACNRSKSEPVDFDEDNPFTDE